MSGAHATEVHDFVLHNCWFHGDEPIEARLGLQHDWTTARSVGSCSQRELVGADCSLSVALLFVQLTEMVSDTTVL